MFLDIVVFLNGTAVVIDEEELQSVLNKKEISKQDYELAYNVVKNIKEEFIDNFEHLKSFTEQINAEEILTNLKYQQDKKERVVNCVLHHRSSKNAENIEELCVCDADILAHFDNIPMIFYKSFTMGKMTLNDISMFIQGFQKDYDDLSDKTKDIFKHKYENIMQVLFGENWKKSIN